MNRACALYAHVPGRMGIHVETCHMRINLMFDAGNQMMYPVALQVSEILSLA